MQHYTSCATGIGCVANAVLGGMSLDYLYTGSKQVVSGLSENTLFNNALQSMGMSPEAAMYAEMVLGLGAALKVAKVVNAGVVSYEGGVNSSVLLTSEGKANAATYPLLKNQLASENLANIAAQDSRLAAAVRGEVGIGSGTAAEANQLGRAWVGDGARLATDQVNCPGCLWSVDGTRFYRPPTLKPNTPSEYNPTGVQANFEQWSNGKKISNGHLVVTP